MKQFLKVFSQNKCTHTHALYVYGIARYLMQKGTKRQMSVYYKMQI